MERLTIWRAKVERPSAGLLAVGLVVAIVAADELPQLWSTALFAILLVLDAITIAWLTRPCDERRPSSPNAPRARNDGTGPLPARCGAGR